MLCESLAQQPNPESTPGAVEEVARLLSQGASANLRTDYEKVGHFMAGGGSRPQRRKGRRST